MLMLYKTLLAPVLLAQGLYLRRTALRLPEAEGARSGVVPAPTLPAGEHSDPPAVPELRLLFVGDSSAAGVGVDQQDDALAMPTARALAEHFGCSVSWQLVAKSGVNTKQALALIDEHDIAPADVVVTALGTNDVTSQQSPRNFRASYRELVATLLDRTGAAGFVFTGLPPLRMLPAAPQPLRWYLGRYADVLDRFVVDLSRSDPDFRYVPLGWAAQPEDMAADRFHPGPGQYRHWSGLVLEAVVGLARSGGRVGEALLHRP